MKRFPLRRTDNPTPEVESLTIFFFHPTHLSAMEGTDTATVDTIANDYGECIVDLKINHSSNISTKIIPSNVPEPISDPTAVQKLPPNRGNPV